MSCETSSTSLVWKMTWPPVGGQHHGDRRFAVAGDASQFGQGTGRDDGFDRAG